MLAENGRKRVEAKAGNMNMMNLGKSLRSISRRHKLMMRWDTAYLMEGLLHPGNTPTLPWTLPLLTTHMTRPPNRPTTTPPLSSATAGNSGGPPRFNVPNHPTIHPTSSHHSITTPNLSKPPHRPEAHPRLYIQVSGIDTQIPTQIRSAAEAPSSDKERDLPRDKGPTPDREFVERRQSGFPRSCRGDTSGDHIHTIITTHDK